MRRFLLPIFFLFALIAGISPALADEAPASPESKPEQAQAPAPTAPTTPAPALSAPAPMPPGPKTAYVVRIDGAISDPSLFILRRAVKDALDNKVDVLVIDLNTPGGSMGSMLEIMEALTKFPGRTVTYINDEAISAGSYIATVTDEIWFSPHGTMGAADVVKGDGSDIGETMKLKLHSYIDAKIRSLAGNKGIYRRDVQRAMMDANFELKIGETVIKPKGELLSLTADEAVKTYGTPPVPLLAAGVAKNVDEVLRKVCGTDQITVKHFEKNWAEYLALFLQWASPVLLAIAGICVIIEYKTPGFGAFGIIAAVLFLVVFAGNYVSGLAGYEPLALLLLGVILITVEMIFFPGTYVVLSLGILSLFAGLTWSMLDIWPQKSFEFTPGIFLAPLLQFSIAGVIFCFGILALWQFLPKSVLKNHVILEAVVESEKMSPAVGADFDYSKNSANNALPAIGAIGKTITDLRLAGVVEIAGKRFNAVSPGGMVDRGKKVVVSGVRGDALEVEEAV